MYDVLLSWNLVVNAVIPPFPVALLILKQEFGGVELCNISAVQSYDKEELSVACIFPGNSEGTSTHLSCASHVSTAKMLWQRHRLSHVVYPAASSFGCP